KVSRVGSKYDRNATGVMSIPLFIEIELSCQRRLTRYPIERRRISWFPSLREPILPIVPIERCHTLTENRPGSHLDVGVNNVVHRKFIIADGRRPVGDAFHQSEHRPKWCVLVLDVTHQRTV